MNGYCFDFLRSITTCHPFKFTGAKHIEKVKEKYQSLGGTATLTNEPTADGTIDAQGSGVKADKPKCVYADNLISSIFLFCWFFNFFVNCTFQLWRVH